MNEDERRRLNRAMSALFMAVMALVSTATDKQTLVCGKPYFPWLDLDKCDGNCRSCWIRNLGKLQDDSRL
jgi:hypothetical protein